VKSNLYFTGLIFSISLLAYFCPQLIVTVYDFETKALILPLLMLIMFGMGTHLSFEAFLREWKNPKSIGLGILCQFLIMPVIGLALAKSSNLAPEIAAGILLVGCSPSGLASNVMCFIAKANLALSISLTTCATLLAPFITPVLMSLTASEYIAIDPKAMFITMLKLVVVPVIAGMLVRHFLPKRWFFILSGMPLLSMAGIIIIVAIIIANGRPALIQIGGALLFFVVLHNALGFLFGYIAGKLAKLDESSCRALAFEIGMQNSGLASGIALTMNKVATMGLAAALFSSVQNITGSALAAYWSSKKVDETTTHKESALV
jgi:BASS family bile acid:Na+ symporter